MQWPTAVGLEKCNWEQRIENGRMRTENREHRTVKLITESPLIADGTVGWAGQYLALIISVPPPPDIR